MSGRAPWRTYVAIIPMTLVWPIKMEVDALVRVDTTLRCEIVLRQPLARAQPLSRPDLAALVPRSVPCPTDQSPSTAARRHPQQVNDHEQNGERGGDGEPQETSRTHPRGRHREDRCGESQFCLPPV